MSDLDPETLARIEREQADAYEAALRDSGRYAVKSHKPNKTNNVRVSLSEAVYRKASEIEAKPVNWLWHGRIARGKVIVVAGHPGLGKSQLTCSMAAITTTGGLWPVDRTVCDVGNVIFLSAEDDAADTIRPRLEAAGADLDKVFILDAIRQLDAQGQTFERSFNLSVDLPRLDDLIQKIGNVTLIVIDPITAYLGETDSHKTAEVRALLSPLQKLAEKHQSAIVCVSHFNKSNLGDPMARVTGSYAFVQAARAAHVVCKDKDDPTKRLFLPMKNNLAPDSTGLAFNIQSHIIGNDIETSRISWLPDVVTVTAIEALNVPLDPEDMSERGEAKEWLRDALKDGPMARTDVEAQAKKDGHKWRTVRRAKDELGIKPVKTRFDGGWEWALPKVANMASNRPIHNNVDTFDSGGHLREFPEENTTSLSSEGGHFPEGAQGAQGGQGWGEEV